MFIDLSQASFSCYNRAMTDIELKDGGNVNQLFSSDVKLYKIRKSLVTPWTVPLALSKIAQARAWSVDLCAGNGPRGTSLQALGRRPRSLVSKFQERLADMATRSIALNDWQQMSMITDDLKHLLNISR